MRILRLAAPTAIVVAMTLAIAVAGCKKKATAGAPCDNPDGCVIGSVCVMKAGDPMVAGAKPVGICRLQCVNDAECGELTCHDSLCQAVAALHEDCSELPCAGYARCLRHNSGTRTCHSSCITDATCESGERCQMLVPDVQDLMAGQTRRYCLPAP